MRTRRKEPPTHFTYREEVPLEVLAASLRVVRAERDWTKHFWATRAGVDYNVITRAEKMQTVPHRKTVDKLAKAAGLTTREFLDRGRIAA